MANSFQTHTGDGSTLTFSWAQIDGYLSTAHLYISVNGVVKTAVTDYTLNTSAKTVTFTAPNLPTAGSYVEIRRNTPKTVAGLQVNFADASVLTAGDMNAAQKQQLFIAQEAQDTGAGGMGLNATGTGWDAENKPIERVSPPTNLSDAATKQYVDSLSLFGAFTVPQSWSFNGNASTEDFPLTAPVPTCTDPAMFIVEVNGVLQRPLTNYDIVPVGGGYEIQFTAPPGSGTANIIVRNFGVARNALEVLPNASVTAQYIGIGAVETAKIQDGAVTTVKLADSAVTTPKLADGNITTVKLVDGSITTAKILDANVTASKMAVDAIATNKIIDLAVTTAKLANISVTNAKVASDCVNFSQMKQAGFTGSGTALRLVNADANGALALTAASAIPLHTFAVPTADIPMNNRTLTNLQTGTITPTVLLGATPVTSYTTQTGRYIKVGRVVTFTLQVTVNVVGAGTGGVSIGGLPFVCAASGWAPVSVMCYTNFVGLTAGGGVLGYVDSGTQVILLRFQTTTGTLGMTNSNIAIGSAFYISGTYISET